MAAPTFELSNARIAELRMSEKKPTLLRIAAPWEGPAAWKALADITRDMTLAGQVRKVKERRFVKATKPGERDHYEVVPLLAPELICRFEVEGVPVSVGRTHGETGADVEIFLEMHLRSVKGEQAGALEAFRQKAQGIHAAATEDGGEEPLMDCIIIGSRSSREALLVDDDEKDAQLNIWPTLPRLPADNVLELEPAEARV